MSGISRNQPSYTRAVMAMVAAGLASFNTLYATQALLPTLTSELGIPPTHAALTVSATTGALAIFIVPASILSERFGRGRVLLLSVLCAVTLGLIVPWAPNIEAFILGRALQGILLAGVPAVAMTWLSEEIHPDDLAHAMGLYVAGTSLGGLLGRIIPSSSVEVLPWQWALTTNAFVAFIFAIAFVRLLPKQQQFQAKKLGLKSETRAMIEHWKNPQLAALFLTGLLNMGCFVSLYNYIGYRMIEHFELSEALAGSLFLLYLSGTWSSAQAGRLVSSLGTGRAFMSLVVIAAVGLVCTAGNLAFTGIGLLLYTAAFFAIHSTASGAIGKIAQSHRAEASSMYLFCYYSGSSVIGWASGYIFSNLGWSGLIIELLLLTVLLGITVIYFARAK